MNGVQVFRVRLDLQRTRQGTAASRTTESNRPRRSTGWTGKRMRTSSLRAHTEPNLQIPTATPTLLTQTSNPHGSPPPRHLKLGPGLGFHGQAPTRGGTGARRATISSRPRQSRGQPIYPNSSPNRTTLRTLDLTDSHCRATHSGGSGLGATAENVKVTSVWSS